MSHQACIKQQSSKFKNPPASACRGHRGCVIWNSSLFNNYGSCFQPSSYQLLSDLKARIGGRSAPPDPELAIRFIIQNPADFMLVCKTQKTRKTAPETTQKRQTSMPKFIKNDFKNDFKESIFAIHSLRKLRFWSPQHRNFGSEIDNKVTWKQTKMKFQVS